MSLFLSRYCNSIDKKGRVSVPSNYRQIASINSVKVNEDKFKDFAGVVLYPSIKNKCIEACTLGRLNDLAEMIYNLDPYSDERDAFETIILGEAVQLSFDPEGRVLLPKNLMEFADLDSSATFVGKGQVFEIWNPELFHIHLNKVQEIAANNKLLLKNIQQARAL